ncbi:hypothetical protein NQ318_022411 [Aromia moschata]|uniref:G-protein coupled receptors family 3 profile domain-containing protein n=1 Tax=Aromia moschata TaxID=1265417 RepID=A0AAV8Z5X4_9CUCU|nr:hypothetical protein NQ318_022411 [Aromia moschata]
MVFMLTLTPLLVSRSPCASIWVVIKIFGGFIPLHPPPHECLRLFSCFSGSGYAHMWAFWSVQYVVFSVAWAEYLDNVSDTWETIFQCKKCAPGCHFCRDLSPLSSDISLALQTCWARTANGLAIALLVFSIFCVICTIALNVYMFKHRKLKVFKVASPIFLSITLFGCATMYLEMAAIFPVLDTYSCIATKWSRHLGFCVTYTALLMKTWRVSLTYRVKSAHKVKLTDKQLLQWMVPILLVMLIYLGTWTLSDTPTAEEIVDNEELRFKQCVYNWWDHSLAIGEVLFLAWGIRVCYNVRNAESLYNEARLISYAIYNIAIVNIMMIAFHLFIFPRAGPNIKYLLGFIRTQLSTTTTIVLVFGPKVSTDLEKKYTHEKVIVTDDENDFTLSNSEIKGNDGFYTIFHARLEKGIFTDDENDFTLSNSEIKGNDGFYTDNIQNAPEKGKFKGKVKFEDNILPDLASYHYAIITRDWLATNVSNFVPKTDNPPHVPQARPVEELWSHLSRKVYGGGWKAQNEEQVRRRIFQNCPKTDGPFDQTAEIRLVSYRRDKCPAYFVWFSSCPRSTSSIFQVIRVLKGQGDQWDNRARSRGVTASFSLNGIGLVPEDAPDLYQENEELKEEIQKLAAQIEFMKIVHMEMNNRHVKPKTGGYFTTLNAPTVVHSPLTKQGCILGQSKPPEEL